jgi:hypothetical protein
VHWLFKKLAPLYNYRSTILLLLAGSSFAPVAMAQIAASQATANATNVYYKIPYSGSLTTVRAYLDTDRNLSTGFRVNGIGADYYINKGEFYRYSNGRWVQVKKVPYSASNGVATLTAARADIGSPVSLDFVTETSPPLMRSAKISQVLSAPAPVTRFSCGGSVENEVWKSWDANLGSWVRNLLQERLAKQRDVYALYDFQLIIQSAVSMAQRCNRQDRLREFSDVIRIAYNALTPGSAAAPGSQWICGGGSICTAQNGLLNKEVQLTSVQFLGMATAVANALATSGAPLSSKDKLFIDDTMRIATEHLLRWGTDAEIGRLTKNATATPQNAAVASYDLLFTDKNLWQLTMYAELSGLRQLQRKQGWVGDSLALSNETRLHNHLSALLQLFSERISMQRTATGKLGTALAAADLADIDRGYWRLFSGKEYAGYEGKEPPVVCAPSPAVRVAAGSVLQRNDTGWDLSHARRLVPALDALERNRLALKAVFSVSDYQLPAPTLSKAFAGTLINMVWNGNKASPLFSNYWSGSNGWLDAYYSNGECSEGFRPHGVTDSFPTGGYITWARHYPLIGELGARLYDLTNTATGAKTAFMTQYYPRLSASAEFESNAISKFMFHPSLVGVTGVVGR